MTTIYNHFNIPNKVQKELIKNKMKKKRATNGPFLNITLKKYYPLQDSQESGLSIEQAIASTFF